MEKSDLRSAVLEAVANYESERKIFRRMLADLASLPRNLPGKTAILEYLKLFVGQPVHTRELDLVAGIAEYARRIRELDVEDGYEIVTGTKENGVGEGYYLLKSLEPNRARAKQRNEGKPAEE